MRYERRGVLHFRSTPSLVAGAVALVVLVFFTADVLARGAWAVLAQVGPWFALVAWAAIAGLIRPRLDVRADDARLVNPLRSWQVPLTAIREVSTRAGVVVVTTGGLRLRAWGADVPRSAARAGRGEAAAITAALTEDVRSLPAGRGPQPRGSWNWITIGMGAVIVLTCLASLIW